MASLRRLPTSRFWIACFTLPNGVRTQRSTKETDRRKAQKIAEGYEEAAKNAKTEQQARRVISDIYQIVNGDKLASSSIQDYLRQWVTIKEKETASSTSLKYKNVIEKFIDHLQSKAQSDLNHLEAKHISSFRDGLLKTLSVGTANNCLKVIRIALNQAKKDGLIDFNPAERVSIIKRTKASIERRPFTLPELKKILHVASKEWQGLIIFGVYTGQRLSDLATLTWQNIDLESEEIRLTTAKTGRRQVIPLAKPLLDYLESLTSTDNLQQSIFPNAYRIVAEQGRTATLSNQFYEILVEAGLAKPRTYRTTGKGGSTKRQLNELSFHALRHTTTSLLKSLGVSDAVAMEFIGHESKAVSKNYTHIETEALRKAANKLPNIYEKI